MCTGVNVGEGLCFAENPEWTGCDVSVCVLVIMLRDCEPVVARDAGTIVVKTWLCNTWWQWWNTLFPATLLLHAI